MRHSRSASVPLTSTLQQMRIPLPPIDEQRRIVAEIEKQFSRLDEAVANLQRVKANLKRYKAAVLKAAVEGRLVETKRIWSRREAQLRASDSLSHAWRSRGADVEGVGDVRGDWTSPIECSPDFRTDGCGRREAKSASRRTDRRITE